MTTQTWDNFAGKTISKLITCTIDNTITIFFTDDTYLRICVYDDYDSNIIPIKDATFTFQWSDKKVFKKEEDLLEKKSKEIEKSFENMNRR